MNSAARFVTATPIYQSPAQLEEPAIEECARRPPPVWPAREFDESERKIIRLVDAPEGRERHAALRAHVKRHAVESRRLIVMLRCAGGDTEQKLSQLLKSLPAAMERRGTRFVLGIDGVDRWLGRPVRIAALLSELATRGIHIVCAVDARYSDTRALRFYLRMLGCLVLNWSLAPDGTNARWSRFSPPRLDSSEFCDFVRRLNKARVPRFVDGNAEAVVTAATDKSPTCESGEETADAVNDAGESDESMPLAIAALLRAQYAEAYCNQFAVHRLLREWKCL